MKTLRILADRAFTVGIILFAILLPLEIVPNALISVVSILVTLLLLPRPIIWLSDRKHWKLLNPWLGLALLLPGVATLACTLPNPAYVHLDLLRTLAVLLFRAWLVAQFADKADMQLFKWATVIVGSLVTLFGFYQFFGDLAGLKHSLTFLRETYSSTGSHPFPRVHSTAREPLLLANYLFIPIALLGSHLVTRRSYRISSVGLLSLMIVLVFTLDARSGVYALMAAFAALLYSLRHKARLALKSTGIALAAVALGAIILLVATGPGVFRQFIHHGTNFSDASFQNRVKTWDKFPGIFTHNPVFGVGLGNSSRAILGPNCGTLPSDPPVFNNTYLTIAADLGIVGLASLIPLLCLLAAFVWKEISRGYKSEYLAYSLILIAYSVQITSYEAFLNLRFWAIIGLALAASRLMGHNHEHKKVAV